MEWIKGISPITFPDFGWFLNPPSGIKLGSVSINFYGLLIALGLMLAVIYAWKRSKEFGINQDHLTDGVLWIAPFAILCARLYYCAFRWEEGGYADDPISVLYIWNGGLAIYGAVIGGLFYGFVETFTAAYVSTAYKDVITFVILIVILSVAPNGIFKEKVIE